MFSFWNWNCCKINFNFPTNQKCLSYFNLIWSFVAIFVIARGSTYSLSKFSRLHYKSFKSSDHNVHLVWHVQRGNMNMAPQGENGNCWSRETSFNHKLRKCTVFAGTWAETPLPPHLMAKTPESKWPAGEKTSLGFHWIRELRNGSDHSKLQSEKKSENSKICGVAWLWLYDSGEGAWSRGLHCMLPGGLLWGKETGGLRSHCICSCGLGFSTC